MFKSFISKLFKNNEKAEHLQREGIYLHNNEGKYKEAASKFRAALQTCTHQWEAKKSCLVNLGNSLKKLKEFERAIEIINKALDIDPDYERAKNEKADVLNEEGYCLYKNGKYKEALEKFQLSIVTCTDSWKNKKYYLVDLGNNLKMLNDYEQAINHIEMALVIDPDYEDAKKAKKMVEKKKILDLGNYYKEIRNYDEAKECFKNLKNICISRLDFDYFFEEALYGEAETLYFQGKYLYDNHLYSEASEKLKAAAKNSEYKISQHRFVILFYNCQSSLGKSYRMMKDYDKAVTCYSDLYADTKRLASCCLNEKKLLLAVLNYQGSVLYFEQKNYQEAALKYQKTFEIDDETQQNLTFYKKAYLLHLGNIYKVIGHQNFIESNNESFQISLETYEKALVCYKKVLKSFDEKKSDEYDSFDHDSFLIENEKRYHEKVTTGMMNKQVCIHAINEIALKKLLITSKLR